MRNFSVVDLDEITFDEFKPRIKELEDDVMDLVLGIETLCFDFKDQLGGEKSNQWMDTRDKAEAEVRTYKQSLKVRMAELKTYGSVQLFSSSSSFQEEQIRQMREQTEIARKALDDAEKERQAKLNETLRKLLPLQEL